MKVTRFGVECAKLSESGAVSNRVLQRPDVWRAPGIVSRLSPSPPNMSWAWAWTSLTPDRDWTYRSGLDLQVRTGVDHTKTPRLGSTGFYWTKLD